MTDIYTDGACSGNPGPGGWAAVLVEGEGKRAISGGEDRTTNNRMELMAAIRGLEATAPGSEVTVHSDSSYLVNTMTRGWKRNVNADLWAQLDDLVAGRRVTWAWVKGHAGNPLNEEADSLAFRESQARTGRTAKAPPASADPAAPYLTHVDEAGRASMVDVGGKPPTRRTAVAEGRVAMRGETLRLIREDAIRKGDVLAVARVAGIMAAKRTPDLVPLCHVLPLDSVSVDLEADGSAGAVLIRATASTTARTGVEMEALTAVAAAALTVYDMCKAVDRGMRVEGIRLVSKSGGRSGARGPETPGGRQR